LAKDGRLGHLNLGRPSPEFPEGDITEKDVHWFDDRASAAEFLRGVGETRGKGLRVWRGEEFDSLAGREFLVDGPEEGQVLYYGDQDMSDGPPPCWNCVRLHAEHLAGLYNADPEVVERDMDTQSN
jgi:hypothetical protein